MDPFKTVFAEETEIINEPTLTVENTIFEKSPVKKKRGGRPLGSKNKKTLSSESNYTIERVLKELPSINTLYTDEDQLTEETNKIISSCQNYIIANSSCVDKNVMFRIKLALGPLMATWKANYYKAYWECVQNSKEPSVVLRDKEAKSRCANTYQVLYTLTYWYNSLGPEQSEEMS